MSRERIAIVSARQPAVPPAQTCVSEFENVLAAMLSAEIVPVFAEKHDGGENFDRLIYVGLSYWQLSRMLEASRPLRRRSGPAQAYVFDSFHHYLQRWTERFPQPLRLLARGLRHELRNLGALERIFVPTRATLTDQEAFLGVPLSYLPIGVDAVRFGSQRDHRTIDVNGYGRQPPALTHYLSDHLNVRDGRFRFNHTDHVSINLVTDPVRHRRLFWRMLGDSRIALAYSPESYDPAGRFDCSFVGQRWYESLAAGCAIMGQAPSAADTAELFDWPDALIDLPADPHEAWCAMAALLDDPDRLRAISRRNYQAALSQHDWRHRVVTLADELGIEPGPIFTVELDRLREELDHACVA